MSRQFSIPTVLRMTPNSLLKKFFEKMGHVDLDLDWKFLGARTITPIIDVLGDMTRQQQDDIEGVLRSVFDLACETGIDALFEGAVQCGELNLPVAMPQDVGPYHKAMWAWLNRPAAFEKASLIHRVDNLTWWRKRNDLPRVEPRAGAEIIKRLEEELADFFTWQQGRGQVCTVERFCRADGTHYFFAYPDDFVQNVVTHDEEGNLVPRTFRQTFVVVFAYNGLEGTLELFAKVPTRLKPKLEAIFADVVLGRELDPWQPDAAYDLNVLKDRYLDLTADPEDRLDIAIRKLRLSLKNSGRRILLEVTDDDDHIYRMIDECLNQENASLDDVNITSVTFRFVLLPLEGRKSSSATFDMTYPNSGNLQNQPPARVELIRKYLKRWGIDGVRFAVADLETVGV